MMIGHFLIIYNLVKESKQEMYHCQQYIFHLRKYTIAFINLLHIIICFATYHLLIYAGVGGLLLKFY